MCAADFSRKCSRKIGVAHPAINVVREAPERAYDKTRIESAPRDYHVDALPYSALSLEISGFSYSSIRERRSLAPLRACQRHAARGRGYGKDLIRDSHPQARCLTGIQRISPPRTLGMIAKRRFCVNCRSQNANSAPRLQTRCGILALAIFSTVMPWRKTKRVRR